MARLESKVKLQYYKTPRDVTQIIATWFSAPNKYRALDPCIADGEAIIDFVDRVGQKAQIYGVELSYQRAQEASETGRIDKLLATTFYKIISDFSIAGLVWNNPPYDNSHFRDEKGNFIRHEEEFMERCTKLTSYGGHQVLIVPRTFLGNVRCARHLRGHYSDIRIFRFPGESYDVFKQVVILAIGKKKYVAPRNDDIFSITDLAECAEGIDVSIPELRPGNNEFKIPELAGDPKFYFIPITDEVKLDLANSFSPVGNKDYFKKTFIQPVGAPIEPIVPEKIGHISMELASGEAGNIIIGDMIVKGTIRKSGEEERDQHVDEDGNYKSTKVTLREHFSTRIAIAYRDGTTKMIASVDDVAEFINKHVDALADAMLKRNTPLFDLQSYTPQEWSAISAVATGLSPLPGRKERGLFLIQKLLAIAAVRALKKRKHIIFNAEMGFGKTPVSVGIATLLDAWPMLVVCPGHMKYKWQRTLEMAADPKKPISARVISRPVRAGAMWRHTMVEQLINDAGGDIVNYERFQVDPTTETDPGGRVRVTIEPRSTSASQSIIDVIQKRFSMRGKGGSIKAKLSIGNDGIVAEFVDRDDYTLQDFVDDYEAGTLGKRAAAVIGIEAAKYGSGINPDQHGYIVKKIKFYDEETYSHRRVPMAVCVGCNKAYPLDDVPHFCTNKLGELTEVEIETEIDDRPACGTPMIEMSRWRREGLARLIQKKYRDFFRLYVPDEIHKAKALKTDVGIADGRIISAVEYSVGLTGTLFGGVSSSIFPLLHRRNQEVRKYYSYSDQTEWIEHYGLLEKTWNEKDPREYGRSLNTGAKRWSYRQKEIPGISPAVIRYLLPAVIFGKITDLGYDLPPLREHVDELDMLPDQKNQYESFDDYWLKAALEMARNDKDSGALSKWFSTLRYRPASGFRFEHPIYESKKTGGVISYPLESVVAEGKWLPKETRLAHIVEGNMLAKRKTLVFVEQTGTRDIRDRIKGAIETLVPGARVGTLSASQMTPARREKWIEINAPKLDVMLVNPSLVETGLDLVMFNHIVFYELPTSLYTLWQAMRRVWRLGQASAVDCTFLVYKNTIEVALLQRMGKKLKSAMLLYGDEASGAIIESDDGDLARELINAALSGKSYKDLAELNDDASDLVRGLFSTGTEKEVVITESPMGSPVAQSPFVITEKESIQFDDGQIMQLGLFGNHVEATTLIRKRRR